MLLIVYLASLFFTTAWCQTRTIWQYQLGPIVNNPYFGTSPSQDHTAQQNGFALSDPIPAADTNWLDCYPGDSYCKSASQINTTPQPSRLPAGNCWESFAFAYFQTYITVPDGVTVTQFTVQYPGNVVDDAARISIYNSLYPGGQTLGFTFYQEASTVDLAPYLTTGVNRLIITQEDSCCCGNTVYAIISLNGQPLLPTCVPPPQVGPCYSSAWDPSVADCVLTPLSGTTCDDGNSCTQGDVCTNGVCAGTPILCSALDQCHVAGTCTDGVCSNPTVPDGTTCTDGNACTVGDTCSVGVCVSGTPVVCTALDQCHVVGTCDPATGICSNPNKCDGKLCDDGNACTQLDTCKNGVCVGIRPIVCTVESDCQEAGDCNTTTGLCSHDNKCDGTTCDDGNACTINDTCLDGDCTPGAPKVCEPLDQCHVAGECDSSTGNCSNPKKADGSACDDGDPCTENDSCKAGVCKGKAKTCKALDSCHVAGVCDSTTGECSNPNKPNGVPCNDGNACTKSDTCQAGVCTGSEPVVCKACDQCHNAGTCDPATGKCSDPEKADGTACNDNDACTQTDVCTKGKCTGSGQVCCRTTSGRCGTCVSDCSGSHQSVLTLFKQWGRHTSTGDVERGSGGGCTGGKVCCVPKDQSTCRSSTSSCSIPEDD